MYSSCFSQAPYQALLHSPSLVNDKILGKLQLAGTGAGTLVSGAQYNTLGMMKEINLGNGLKTTYSYYGLDGLATDGGPFGSLYQIWTQYGSEDPLQNIIHTWDANGNLTTRNTAGVVESFGYDFLDRLTSVSVSGNTTATYTYDEIGNITSKNGVVYTYHPEHPHAVEWVGSDNYTYDANGNMLVRGWSTVNQTLEWDAENRLISVSFNSTVIAEFVYDGDGNRIAKKEAGETVFYINGYYEQNMATGNATSNYYLGGKLIATSENGTIRYIHTDHLAAPPL